MAPQSKGRSSSLSSNCPAVNFSASQGFHLAPDETALSALNGISSPSLSSTSLDKDVDEENGDADFQLDDSLDALSLSESLESASDHGNKLGKKTPFLHHSNSSFLIANSFAPPFYNRPPTPLPLSLSLTSFLLPSFSTNTSRPTTPDSSENDTPNNTEAAVAQSARAAITLPRASPKVPTYEYYEFVLYFLSLLAFCTSISHRRI